MQVRKNGNLSAQIIHNQELSALWLKQAVPTGSTREIWGNNRDLRYGDTVAKSVCSSALGLLMSLVCCILWCLPKLLEAEQAAVAVPVQHTLLNAHSALASAKEWDEMALMELCPAVAPLLPGPRLVWYLHYMWLCTLILICGAFAWCGIRLSSLLLKMTSSQVFWF